MIVILLLVCYTRTYTDCLFFAISLLFDILYKLRFDNFLLNKDDDYDDGDGGGGISATGLYYQNSMETSKTKTQLEFAYFGHWIIARTPAPLQKYSKPRSGLRHA